MDDVTRRQIIAAGHFGISGTATAKGTALSQQTWPGGTMDCAIDTTTAFWLATTGGGEAIGMPVGLLQPGYRFDAVAIDLDDPGGVIRRLDDLDDDHRMFEKMVRLAQPGDIREVWVEGTSVHCR